MTAGFFELTLIIGAAAVFGVVAKILRQPIMLAYLAVGLLMGYFSFSLGVHEGAFKVFSELGITFLLFLVGLEINYTSLRLVGKASVILGILQIIFTAVIGYLLAGWFGFSSIEALYIAMALTFSSTIIVVKLLSDKKDLQSLYGKLSIGFLLVQDFVAIFVLIILSGIVAGNGFSIWQFFVAILKGSALFMAIFLLSKNVFPKIFDKIARSDELLFLVTIAWSLALATIVNKIGFSIEIGGFLAGLALANSAEHYQIASKVRSLRDFFIVIFFVILGASVIFSHAQGITMPIIVFSLFVLIGNPLVVLAIMGFMGYRKRTSFMTGVTTAQISEFSLVLVALGAKAGHIGGNIVALITGVGIITIALSSYMIVYSDYIFSYLTKALSIFERKNFKKELKTETEFRKSYVLIGCHRSGQSIASMLSKDDLLVVDFDPEIIHWLKTRGYTYIFGDCTDVLVFEKMNCQQAKAVISTNPHLEDNLALLSMLKALDHRPKTIFSAENERDAKILYEEGADYVLLPHITAGYYLGKIISVDPSLQILEQLRQKDMALMQKANGVRI